MACRLHHSANITDVNCGPLSDTMVSGGPHSVNKSSSVDVVVSAVGYLFSLMMCGHFE